MPKKNHSVVHVFTSVLIMLFSFLETCNCEEHSIQFRELGPRLEVGPEPYFIVTEDFNGDQLPDLAVANRGDLRSADHPRPGNDTISVLLSKGKGMFHPTVEYKVGFAPYTLKFGDFNQDGVTDLAVVCFQSNDDRDVAILQGQRDGTFLESSYLKVDQELPYNKDLLPEGSPVYASPGLTSLEITDVNSDGNQDIVTVSWSCDAIITFFGDGKGQFPHQEVISGIPSGPRDIAIEDFNQDGSPDLILTHYNSDRITVWGGSEEGRFTKQADFPCGGKTPYHLRVADLNSDGIMDFIVGNRGASDDVSMFLGKGGFQFSFLGSFSAGEKNDPDKIEYEIRDVAVGDLDGDGSLEVVAACRLANRIVVWRVIEKEGHPALQLAGSFEIPDGGPRAFALADFDHSNHNGIKELVTALGTEKRLIIIRSLGR